MCNLFCIFLNNNRYFFFKSLAVLPINVIIEVIGSFLYNLLKLLIIIISYSKNIYLSDGLGWTHSKSIFTIFILTKSEQRIDSLLKLNMSQCNAVYFGSSTCKMWCIRISFEKVIIFERLPPINVSPRMRYCMSRVLSLALGITFDCFDRPLNVSSPELEADSVHDYPYRRTHFYSFLASFIIL